RSARKRQPRSALRLLKRITSSTTSRAHLILSPLRVPHRVVRSLITMRPRVLQAVALKQSVIRNLKNVSSSARSVDCESEPKMKMFQRRLLGSRLMGKCSRSSSVMSIS
ncbi:hypothetical protein Pmar_PMAR022717, partial [Perkinsus marinus ATCC 50983]